MRHLILLCSLTILSCMPKSQTITTNYLPEMHSIPNEKVWHYTENDSLSQRLQKSVEKENLLIEIKSDSIKEYSRWAQKEMENYQLQKEQFKPKEQKPYAIYEKKSHYILNYIVEKLPTHSPIVEREVHLYLFMKKENLDVTEGILTIRGRALE